MGTPKIRDRPNLAIINSLDLRLLLWAFGNQGGKERKKKGVVVVRGFTKNLRGGGGGRRWSYRKDWIVLDGGPTINKESSFSSFYT